jgi:integrase
VTVGQLFEAWFDQYVRQHWKDEGREAQRLFTRDVLPVLGDVTASDVITDVVMRVLDQAIVRDASRVALLVLSLLRQMFRWGLPRGDVTTDPTLTVHKTVVARPAERDRVLSEAELRVLAAALPASDLPQHSQSAVWILLASATRVSELSMARWVDVDLEKGIWTIPATNSKNRREHIVHLSSFALAQFRKLKALRQNGWVLPGRHPNQPIDLKILSRQMRDRQRERPLAKRSSETGTLGVPGGPWTLLIFGAPPPV